jgi:TonB-dependent SusC/RagA subfamily outer membrane receptor
MGSEEPLLVLDGSPMQITFLNSLNPRDILEVYVLRDTAFYGSRGANGVLVVTTKRPG